jgi:hypothetical protein
MRYALCHVDGLDMTSSGPRFKLRAWVGRQHFSKLELWSLISGYGGEEIAQASEPSESLSLGSLEARHMNRFGHPSGYEGA